MSRHIADKRTSSSQARVQHFLRIARNRPQTWHRKHLEVGATRLVQFLRIERGRSV